MTMNSTNLAKDLDRTVLLSQRFIGTVGLAGRVEVVDLSQNLVLACVSQKGSHASNDTLVELRWQIDAIGDPVLAGDDEQLLVFATSCFQLTGKS